MAKTIHLNPLARPGKNVLWPNKTKNMIERPSIVWRGPLNTCNAIPMYITKTK